MQDAIVSSSSLPSEAGELYLTAGLRTAQAAYLLQLPNSSLNQC